MQSFASSEFSSEDVFKSEPDSSPKSTDRKSSPGTPERRLTASLVSEFKMKELSGELQSEPLLTPNPHRFVLFPIQHKDVRHHSEEIELTISFELN